MTPTKRLTLLLAAAAVVTIAWSVPGEAQVIFRYPPYGYAINRDSSVRLEVTPKEAEVYVDGYYAGIVDDFDGVFQRLHVEPGPHDITLYRDGYRTVRQRVYLTPDSTFKIKDKMEPLAPGETTEARPVPSNPPPAPLQAGRQAPRGPIGRRVLPPPNGQPPTPPPNGPAAGNPPPPGQPAIGTLTIHVQPSDADVSIDGQPWPPSQGQDRLVMDVSEGSHIVQVRKPGYVGYLTQVDVRRGETMMLDVSLRAQP